MTVPFAMRLWNDDRYGAGRISPARALLEIYPPKAPERVRAPLILIFPGGGYGIISLHEAGVVAEILSKKGLTVAVCLYRVAPYRHPAPLADARRAIRILRAMCDSLPASNRGVAVVGFSAGGHLATLLALRPDISEDSEDDLAANISCRPDRLALIYSLISLRAPTHEESIRNLFGPDADAAVIDELSIEQHIGLHMPKTFLIHAHDDPIVPVAQAIQFIAKCKEVGVDIDVHILPGGKHGFGLRENLSTGFGWRTTLINWLMEY